MKHLWEQEYLIYHCNVVLSDALQAHLIVLNCHLSHVLQVEEQWKALVLTTHRNWLENQCGIGNVRCDSHVIFVKVILVVKKM